MSTLLKTAKKYQYPLLAVVVFLTYQQLDELSTKENRRVSNLKIDGIEKPVSQKSQYTGSSELPILKIKASKNSDREFDINNDLFTIAEKVKQKEIVKTEVKSIEETPTDYTEDAVRFFKRTLLLEAVFYNEVLIKNRNYSVGSNIGKFRSTNGDVFSAILLKINKSSIDVSVGNQVITQNL